MTKSELEKPVVSQELADDFEKHGFEIDGHRFNLDLKYYEYPEIYGLHCKPSLQETLARMYVLGYEIKEPDKFVIESPVTSSKGGHEYLKKVGKGYIWDFSYGVAFEEYSLLDKSQKWLDSFLFTADEIMKDPQLLKLKQFAVKVE